MAGDDFNSASPDKEYLRVYPLGMKELDIFAGNTEEPADGTLPELTETGKEQYFVVNKDGTGAIIAADPADMASEFLGNISDLSVNALEGRFEALQSAFFEHGHLLSPPYEGNTPIGILPEQMLNSLSDLQSEIGNLRTEAANLEGSMIVLDENTADRVGRIRGQAEAIEHAIKEAEIVAPLVEDSYLLINEVEGNYENTLSGEQFEQLHETVFGVEPSQDHSIPAYARG